MYRTDDKPVQFSVISYQPNTFAVPLWDKKAGEHHSVGELQDAIIPEAMCLDISVLAGS